MKKTNISEWEASQKINENYFLNPLFHSTEENLKFLDSKWQLAQPYTKISSSSALLYELAKARQVESIYLEDASLRARHSYFIQNRSGCFFNSLRFSGDPYVSSLGLYRLYCNGALSYYDKIYHGYEVYYGS